MAIVDKKEQRFDEVTKADRLGIINALIHASINLDSYTPNLKNINKEDLTPIEKFIFKLLPTLELYRKEGRLKSFGDTYEDGFGTLDGSEITEDDLKKFKKKINSLKTPGGELGIWIDANYTLSKMAKKVAENKLATRRYISIVFLNLFSFFEDENGHLEYKHLLFEVLTYIKEKGLDEYHEKSFLFEIFGFDNERDDTKRNNQKNILFDYLISTEFFDVNEDGKKLHLLSFWQENIDALLSLCNLEYENSTLKEVESALNRGQHETKLAYANYVAKNEDQYELLASKMHLSTDNKKTDEEIFEIDNSAEIIKGSVGINRIFFGAPGTGKSFSIKDFIHKNGIENYSDKEDHPNVFRTTLHPEFSYHDFIGQIMPVVKNEEITYEFTPQIFTKALKRAFHKEILKKQPVFLILEEMSRANVAAVFGDLFQLLDRDETGQSEYKIDNPLIAKNVFGDESKKIYIPSNLYIIGTVNTSDQNVYVMDTAFKRRFEFKYLPTKVNSTIIQKNTYDFSFGELKFTWSHLVTALNKYIVDPLEKNGLGLSEDKQLGYFFIKFKRKNEENKELHKQIDEYNFNQIVGKLIQYLWNDVEKTSYSDNKIFADDISYFGELYEKTKARDNIFSNNFINRLKNEIQDNTPKK